MPLLTRDRGKETEPQILHHLIVTCPRKSLEEASRSYVSRERRDVQESQKYTVFTLDRWRRPKGRKLGTFGEIRVHDLSLPRKPLMERSSSIAFLILRCLSYPHQL
jgi:hypothetical protein